MNRPGLDARSGWHTLLYMAPKTAIVFSLALFPPLFLFQRVVNADVVFVLSDRRLDDKSHANQCVIRSAVGGTRKIEIPVRTKGMPIDQVEVAERSTWFPKMQHVAAETRAGPASPTSRVNISGPRPRPSAARPTADNDQRQVHHGL
jgi:hypothetical protein